MRPISTIELFITALAYSLATGGATAFVTVVLLVMSGHPDVPAVVCLGLGGIVGVLTFVAHHATWYNRGL